MVVTPLPPGTSLAPRLRQRLHGEQQRHDHEEEHQRIGAGDLEAQRGVGIGKTDGQRLVERRVQQPRHVELAHRQRHHHQRSGEDAGAAVGQHDMEEALAEAGAERGRALLQRLQVDRHQHRQHRAHHERQREQDMADQDEHPRGAEAAGTAIGDDQRQRGRETRHRHRHHQQLLQRARQRPLSPGQHIGGGDAEHERAGEAGKRDADARGRSCRDSRPHLADPAQGQAAPDADEVVRGHAGEHRQDHRHDQERADQQRKASCAQKSEPRWRTGASSARGRDGAPAAVRAKASTIQVTAPSTNDSAAAAAMFACSVNSV